MKKLICSVSLLILVLLLTGCSGGFFYETGTSSIIPENKADSDTETTISWDTWSMFRHDAAHSGYCNARAPITPTLFWKVNVGVPLYSSPAIVNKMVFTGAKDVLLAFDERNGRTLWKAPMVGEIYSSPAADPLAGKSGLVYCASYGSRSSTLSAFDMQTGRRVWWQWMSTKSSPIFVYNIIIGTEDDALLPIIPRSTLFIGSFNRLYALNADTGATLWTFLAYGLIDSTPAVDERRVYFGTNDNIIYAVDRYSGKGIWKFEAKGPVVSSPSVGEKLLIAASLDGVIYCLDKQTGELIWAIKTEGPIQSSPAYYKGSIYIGSGMELLKLNEEGKIIWSARTLGETISSPAVSSGKVYIGSSKTKSSSIFCFDERSGKPLWSRWMEVESSPSAAYWSLVVASLDGNIYCFNDLE
ncbi:MAG: PQQ-like beta-propeller repeat protein [Spirochaetales bacterium]|nr:PQQ-like beta-propeller repeat protein [Spirochaetales bacterium]